MNLDRYKYQTDKLSTEYEFYSEGPKGRILKMVRFQLYNSNGFSFYNLYLGDYNKDTGYLDDLSVTNNGDAEKVLATVAAIVVDFTNYFQDAMIYTEGSTLARTRRYQISISKFWGEIGEIFNVYARAGETWELFQKNRNYNAFLVNRKEKDFLTLEELNEPYMATHSKHTDRKDPDRVIIDRRVVDMPDLSNDPAVLRKTAAAKEAMDKYPFPMELLKKSR